MLSPKDRSTFDQIWPTRSSAAIAAMERIKSGGLAWRKLPLSVREFLGSGIIDDLLADRAAAVERPKMRLTKAQLEYLEGRQRAAS